MATISVLSELAKMVCILGQQPGIAFSTNGYGTGPVAYPGTISTCDKPPLIWGDQLSDSKFEEWINGRDLVPGSRFQIRVEKVMYDESSDRLFVKMSRRRASTSQDHEQYAKRCGISSSDEAVRKYGDLEYSIDEQYVSIMGIEGRVFLSFIVPYCWQD